jgi:putative ABC transport system ATP-binding protein
MGFIFQSYNLLPVYTVFENVELPLILNKIDKDERRSMVEQAVESVGLTDKMIPDQNMLRRRRNASEQPVAERLYISPLLVLADEPTANLELRKILSYLKNSSTIK